MDEETKSAEAGSRLPGDPPEDGNWTWVERSIRDRLADIGPHGAIIYLALLTHTNRFRACWPSIGTLSRVCGMSQRSVRRALDHLVTSELIRRERRTDPRGLHDHNRYTLLPLGPGDTAAPTVPPDITRVEGGTVCRDGTGTVPPDSTLLSPEHQERDSKKETQSKETQGGARARFTPPSVEEVRTYCQERGNGIDAEYFVDYYATRGWNLKGGRPLKDWRAALRTWEKNGIDNKPSGPFRAPGEPKHDRYARPLGMTDRESRTLEAAREFLAAGQEPSGKTIDAESRPAEPEPKPEPTAADPPRDVPTKPAADPAERIVAGFGKALIEDMRKAARGGTDERE